MEIGNIGLENYHINRNSNTIQTLKKGIQNNEKWGKIQKHSISIKQKFEKNIDENPKIEMKVRTINLQSNLNRLIFEDHHFSA